MIQDHFDGTYSLTHTKHCSMSTNLIASYICINICFLNTTATENELFYIAIKFLENEMNYDLP